MWILQFFAFLWFFGSYITEKVKDMGVYMYIKCKRKQFLSGYVTNLSIQSARKKTKSHRFYQACLHCLLAPTKNPMPSGQRQRDDVKPYEVTMVKASLKPKRI